MGVTKGADVKPGIGVPKLGSGTGVTPDTGTGVIAGAGVNGASVARIVLPEARIGTSGLVFDDPPPPPHAASIAAMAAHAK